MATFSRRLATLAFGFALVAEGAFAQSATEVSLAETLYRKARELSAAGNYDEACPKFAESYRLDPATGTLLNLAACHEAQGRFATAWLEYTDALVASRRDRRQSRVKFAQERIAAIEPKLSRLTLQVPPAADHPNLELRLDGMQIGRAARAVPMPVDPGRHVVEAKAPGKKPWSETVEIGAEADAKVVTVPPLEDAPEQAAAPPPAAPPVLIAPVAPAPPARDEATERPIPASVYAVGGVTVALAVATGVTGAMYLSRSAEFNDEGRYDENREQAEDERDSVRTLGVVNLALWIATAGGAGLTSYLYLTRPERSAGTGARGLSFHADRSGAGFTFSGAL